MSRAVAVRARRRIREEAAPASAEAKRFVRQAQEKADEVLGLRAAADQMARELANELANSADDLGGDLERSDAKKLKALLKGILAHAQRTSNRVERRLGRLKSIIENDKAKHAEQIARKARA